MKHSISTAIVWAVWIVCLPAMLPFILLNAFGDWLCPIPIQRYREINGEEHRG